MEGGDGLSRILVAVLMLTASLAGCASSDLDEEEKAMLEAWRDEQPSEDARGALAELDLAGHPVAASGNLEAEALQAPFAIEPGPSFPDDEPFLFLGDARLDDGSQGLLVLDGPRIDATEGSIEQLPLDSVRANDTVELRPSEAGRDIDDEGWAFPPAWEEADKALFFAETTRTPVEQLRIEGFERGVLVTQNDSRPIEPPVRVSAQAFAAEANTTIQTQEATVSLADAALTGEDLRGEVQVQGREDLDDPDAVFARHEGELRAEPGRIASTMPVRLTQAIVDDKPQWRSAVEVEATETTVSVEADGTTWTPVLYREASGNADALLENATVHGPAEDLITVPVERPPTFVEQLWEEIHDEPAAALLIGLPVAIATPWLVMAEALACLAGCPQDAPYPSFMDAGDVGTFYVKVEGDAPLGEHEATVTIEGRNYGPVSFPLTVVVEEPSEPDQG